MHTHSVPTTILGVVLLLLSASSCEIFTVLNCKILFELFYSFVMLRRKTKQKIYKTNIFDKMGDHDLKMDRSAIEREEYVGQ
jgi:uncharacterized membrane protein YecN with MAPEG domain